jgi:hypothetical protein
MNTQAWPGFRCCKGRPAVLRVACQGNYREARSIALMPGFEATLSYSVQVLPKHSHLHSCERTEEMQLGSQDSEAVSDRAAVICSRAAIQLKSL